MLSDRDRAVLTELRRREPLGLDTWIPSISPDLGPPAHLRILTSLFDRAYLAAQGRGAPVRACISAPPQVGKTLTGQHAFARWLQKAPRDFVAYITYGQELASLKSRKVRDLAKEAGVAIRADSRAVDLWQTTADGGLLARGRNAGITGHAGVKCIWYDDPYVNRREAESRATRETIDNDFASTIVTRAHPSTSIIVSHTRWHVDDQIGRLKSRADGRWEFYNIPAIGDEESESAGILAAGAPFWSESGRSLEFWANQRVDAKGDYNWFSLFMGQPRPRGGHVFGDGQGLFTEPQQLVKLSIGVDLAYSAKTQADWSVAVVVGADSAGRTYVLDVVRAQEAAPAFASRLQRLQARYPSARLHWYASGTETGTADFLKTLGVRLKVEPARGDKFARAQPVAAEWNAGRVSVPSGEVAWVADFLDEVLEFTGVSDAHDDQVDALAAAFDGLALASRAPVVPLTTTDIPRPPTRSAMYGAEAKRATPYGRPEDELRQRRRQMGY